MQPRKIFLSRTISPRLLNFLENRFIITEFDIETAVDLSETDELLYTDEQKYNYLQNKYPVLKDLRRVSTLI
ncbi:MAG: hypothetical protein MZV63_12005 [Marinilabiliales bacterium]|nr:hypothetical protein [Marinilabiliales bacterium]